ncbi:MAG: P1 family peptidase [Gemmatimonadaceae bacterium]|nr:P1 family peptidase [Gemmatimonadaceae bacterium]
MSDARAAVAAPLDLARFDLAVGHATDESGATGCTVIRGVRGAHRAAHAVIGRATGSRELALLEPGHLVERVDAILLSGGSAYGLDAAAGVMRWMEARGRGFPVGGGVVPIVPAAVLFDLGPLGRFDARPTPAMAEAACESATSTGIADGAVGAGAGLTVGKVLGKAGAMKGGFGLATREAVGCAAVAMVAVNAFGDVRDAQGRIIAGARRPDGTFADTERVLAAGGPERAFGAASTADSAAAPNTTLAVVAVDASFSKVELQQLARAATAAFHRRLAPAGSSFDGDIVFALSPLEGPSAPLMQAERLVVDALEAAIERAVRVARGRDGVPGLAD